jgi:hypothetical protein
MVDMFDDDDPGDLDWLPTNLRAMRDKKRRKQTQGKPERQVLTDFHDSKLLTILPGRPKEYKKVLEIGQRMY